MSRSRTVPSYRHHKPTGQAVVTIRSADGSRRDVYLGKYNSPESRAEYGRIIAELATAPAGTAAINISAGAGSSVSHLTVDQLLLAFLAHARKHYRRPDGTPTDQIGEFKRAMRPLHKLYGHSTAKDFGPLGLKAVRNEYVAAGNARTLINSRVGKLRRIFKWAVSEQLVPVTTYTALATVEGLEEGRSDARESDPVEPVDPTVVAATLPHLNRHVAGLVLFQQLTGCRPGEASAVRRCDLDVNGEVWMYRPPQHKTRHKKKARTIAVGKGAQTLLRQFFVDDLNAYLFSPVAASAENLASRTASRKTPRFPSHMSRNEGKRVAAPKRRPGPRYTRQSYLTAVVRACDRAGVPHWFPNQLRHLFATEVRRVYGLEAAQVVLGHAKADVTQVYAEKNLALAMKVAGEMG